MQLPDILTDEGRAAIIACLRIAAQMGEDSERTEKDLPAEPRKARVNGRRGNRRDFSMEIDTVATRVPRKRRKRGIVPQ